MRHLAQPHTACAQLTASSPWYWDGASVGRSQMRLPPMARSLLMVSPTFKALLLTRVSRHALNVGGGVLGHKYSRQLNDFKGHSYRQVVIIKNPKRNPHIHPSMNYGFEFISVQKWGRVSAAEYQPYHPVSRGKYDLSLSTSISLSRMPRLQTWPGDPSFFSGRSRPMHALPPDSWSSGWHTMINIVQKSLDLWWWDEKVPMRFRAIVLTGPIKLRVTTR